MTSPLNLPAPGRCQAVYLIFRFAQPCVFVKQLPGPILCALPSPGRDPLSRSYRVSLPSSLTVNHSSALVYSTRLRVSVYGTGTYRISLADFLGSMITRTIALSRGRGILSGSILMVDLPAKINIYTLQPSIPSDGGIVTTPSPHHS